MITGIFFISLNLPCKVIGFKTLDKNNTISVGKKGEEKIQDFLTNKGFVILEKNYRFGKKEIDLIALSPENDLVFVEVKYRKTNFDENPAFTVNKKKQHNIISAAHHYIQTSDIRFREIRFDIAAIIDLGHTLELKYLENAFYPH
jgi:putative endonuclease